MSPINLREQEAVTARAGSGSGRRPRPESTSGQKKGAANRNVKRKLNSVKPRGEKARPLKSTPASAARTPAAKATKKEINKTSPPSRRPASSGAAAGKKSARATLTKKTPLKSTVMDAKEHGGLFINEMRLSASASPVTSSTTTASSVRLSPSPLSSSAGGRSPRASSGAGEGFLSTAYNTSLTQCSPKSEAARRQSDSAITRSASKSGGLFSWLWKLWS